MHARAQARTREESAAVLNDGVRTHIDRQSGAGEVHTVTVLRDVMPVVIHDLHQCS
jgi:hypothetical protein